MLLLLPPFEESRKVTRQVKDASHILCLVPFQSITLHLACVTSVTEQFPIRLSIFPLLCPKFLDVMPLSQGALSKGSRSQLQSEGGNLKWSQLNVDADLGLS
jgi:hypothetical protein